MEHVTFELYSLSVTVRMLPLPEWENRETGCQIDSEWLLGTERLASNPSQRMSNKSKEQ